MSKYYSGIKFKYPFRNYQKSALDSCGSLMDDRRIHIVAAPGSGKTILGLELIRRLDCPVLILVPTINLREQWFDRFFEGFVDEKSRESWEEKISRDLYDLKLINCVTYQALFSCLQNEDAKALSIRLKKAGILTICLDEAHHLRNEWWKALESVVNSMEEEEEPILIALTATPPYDADNREWLRYSKLCGEIDVEINAPSMVKNKCICPYQDYLYLCVPDAEESARISILLSDKKKRINTVLKAKYFYDALMKHPGLSDIEACADTFMADPAYLDSLIAYLNSYATYLKYDYEDGRDAARKAFSHMDNAIRKLIDEDVETTRLSEKQLKNQFAISEENFFHLLDGILNHDQNSFDEAFIEKLKEELTHLLFYRDGKLVKTRSEEQVGSILKNSVSFFDGIADIVHCEREALGDSLRCLILSDRIRKESLAKVQTVEMPGELGCVSIWERLRREEHLGNIDHYMNNREERITDLAMLTANLAILPAVAVPLLTPDDSINISWQDLKKTGYVQLELNDSNRKYVISSVTSLFDRGVIRVLIGTIALLGEGWDAPCVNSVITASNLATYVQTNQIRGRGFRVKKENPEKTANLWHLFCMKPVVEEKETGIYINGYEPGANAENLFHRFDTIIGISHDGTYISSGISRIARIGNRFTEAEIESINRQTKQLAADRHTLYHNWILFTAKNDVDNIRYTVNVAKDKKKYDKTVKKNLWESTRRRLFRDKSYGRARILANTTLSAMKKNNIIRAATELEISYDWQSVTTSVSLCNATNKENHIFTQALEEILGKNIKARYVIKNVGFLNRKYIAVPSVLDKNKPLADSFYRELLKNRPLLAFSRPVLIYTQTAAGRAHLVKARLENLEIRKEKVSVLRQLYDNN